MWWSLFKKKREIPFPRPCRYLKSYTMSQNLQRWGTRSVSLEGMSFERIVSGSPGKETLPMLRPHRPWSFFYFCHTTLWPHVRARKPAETHITINKDMLWMSLDFNFWKYQKSAQEFHGPHSWSQSRSQGLDLYYVAAAFTETMSIVPFDHE